MFNKILSSFLIFALSSSLAFSQNVPAQQQPLPSDVMFTLDDFSKLLYSHADPYNLTHGEATDAYNLRSNDQYGSLGKRAALNLLGTCSHSSAVTGLYRYYKSDATKYNITSSGVYLDYISDSGSCTNLYANLTTGKRTSFITYKNWAVITNGYDLPFKWDGKILNTADTNSARTAGDLVTQLGAPFAELLTGTGLTASRWYQYRMAYYDGTTYKYSTARTNPLLLGASVHSAKLTDIPLGPVGTTHRYIYRTLNQTSRANVVADNTFYLVTDIADNTTTTFSDNVADATISADNPPTWSTVSAGTNVTPPHGIYIGINKDYIWLGNDPSGVTYGQSTAYFSGVANPDYWKTGTDYFLIRPDDGDVINFMYSFLGQWCIGKTNTISKIYTDNTLTSQWQVSQPFSFIGTVAPSSVQVTPVGIMYLGRYGLYKFDGQSSSLVSDVVTKDIRDINPTNYVNVAGIFYNNEYRLSYASIATGAGANNRVLVFDLIRNSFVKDIETINVWSIQNSSDDFGALYSGSSSTDGNILAHSTQPTAYNIRYQADLDAGAYSGTFSADTSGDPNDLILTLGSSIWSADASAWNSETTSTWQADSTPGTWTSAITQINANAFSKLYWNQVLGSAGTITLAIRVGATSGDCASASWSSEFSNPSGSDISGVTANNFVQVRVTINSTDLTQVQPLLNITDNFMIKLVYSQTGTVAETSINSAWTSGWLDLIPSSYMFYLSNYPKLIKEIDVYYEGTAGTMIMGLNNLKGDVAQTININLSAAPYSAKNYYGSGTTKVFRWLPSLPGGSNPPIGGDKFQLSISESGVTSWRIQRVIFRYDVAPYRPYANQ